jgi:FixJ family two-component response regulator
MRGSVAKTPLISIVDDDVSVREATADLLESHGYVAAAFASAEAFLESGHFRDTSCLVTDVKMGGLSGLELQRHLMDAGHRIPTIFMTAFPEEHIRVAALEGGARDFLSKPVGEGCLIACLQGALGNHNTDGGKQ